MNPAHYLMHAYRRHPLRFTHGRGLRLWDAQGNEYLDAISGVAVTNLGHAIPRSPRSSPIRSRASCIRPPVRDRMAGEAGAATVRSRRNGECVLLQFRRGSQRDRHQARPPACPRGVAVPVILVMENSFHGRTLATLSATGSAAVQEGFAPLVEGFVHVPANDIDAIRGIAREREDIVAVLLETVQGEGGVRPVSTDYLRAVRALYDDRHWLLMIDEVQTGLGRTGAWFGYQHADVRPDVVTVAKGLGNGIPIGACLASGIAAKLFTPGRHGSTFGGNPLACRVGCKVLEITSRDELPQRADRLGRRLVEGLRQAVGALPGVIEVRGQGLMVGIELDHTCEDLARRAMEEERLLINVTRGRTIRLLPALVATVQDVDEITTRLSHLLERHLG